MSLTRRAFLGTAMASALAPSLDARSQGEATNGRPRPAPAGVDPILADLLADNDQRVRALLPRQERRRDHRWHGSIPNDFGIHSIGGTAQFIAALVCACRSPASAFHGSSEVAEALDRAGGYLLRAQHDDGTIDLISTNFHSPPDTAFVLEPITAAATIVRRAPWAALRAFGGQLDAFMVKSGEALVTGGVHTPNHRWVVAAALARLNALHPDRRYVARVDEWLAETVDIDPDGQFTEKSTSVYSPVVDRALLTIASRLDRPELREPVRKNLEMTLYYVHPDGEVVTEASRRQDKYQRGSMGRYYYSYRALALIDGNGRFAAMARQIEQTARRHLVSDVAAFLEEPELQRPLPTSEPLPTDYAKVFAYSKLARIRRGAFSATVLADNATVISLRKGGAALEAVRVASAFFGKGQFEGDALEVGGHRYRLRQQLEGPYFQPLSSAQIAAGDHVRMAPNGTLANDSRALRARSNVQHLESVIDVVEADGHLAVTITIGGTDGVPVAIELAFRHGGRLEGVEPVAAVADAYLLPTGTGRYVAGDDAIEFGPGRAEHTWTQLRGALPKWDGQSVYLTGFTPFTTTLTLR
jgi:hypothetical protein